MLMNASSKALTGILFLLGPPLARAQGPQASVMWPPANPATLRHDKAAQNRTLWKASVATFAAANGLDIASSWGKREFNPALAGPSKFGLEGSAIKAAIVGVVIGVEFVATRRHSNPAFLRTLSILNFVDSGVVAGVSAHNFTVPAYSH
jgi:hypothetical protein